MLIENTLRIPCRVIKGCFRFLCPLCNGFDTAVNPNTNLARCFQCEKNFNTIDLVMLVRQADFVQSAKFLQSIHQKEEVRHDRHDLKAISGSNHQSNCRIKLKTPPRQSAGRPRPIREILDGVLSPEHGGISEKRYAESKSNRSIDACQITDEDRILKLEQKLEFLNHQIKKIARTLDVGLASK